MKRRGSEGLGCANREATGQCADEKCKQQGAPYGASFSLFLLARGIVTPGQDARGGLVSRGSRRVEPGRLAGRALQL